MKLNPADNPLLCRNTLVRREVCACRVCEVGSTPVEKHANNKRDAEHLLNFLLACLDNHDSQNKDKPTWNDVSDIAQIRAKLMELAARFITSDNQEEDEITERAETALSVDDDEVMHELIAISF